MGGAQGYFCTRFTVPEMVSTFGCLPVNSVLASFVEFNQEPSQVHDNLIPRIIMDRGSCFFQYSILCTRPVHAFAHQQESHGKLGKLEIMKIFYKNSKDVGMAQKVQKQVKAVTQRSINHGPYMQECRTL